MQSKLHGLEGEKSSSKPKLSGLEVSENLELAKKKLHEPKSSFLKTSLNKEARRRPMKQQNNVIKRSKGQHWTSEDRIRLEAYARALYPKKKRPNFAELGRLLGKHRSTISREWHRGACINKTSELEEYQVYSAEKGRQLAVRASINKGPRGKFTNHIARDLRMLILEKKLSPFAARTVLAKEGKYAWVPCERSVYYAIDADLIGVSRSDLPYKPGRKKRKRNGTRMAYTNVRGRLITERPEQANDRSEHGHWEMDTVLGGRKGSSACLLVLTERMSRLQIIEKMPDKTQDEVVKALNQLERMENSPLKNLKTITCDNGSEFLDFQRIEKSSLHNGKFCDLFFAHPFCSSERGSNENSNRIIRRFIPKGSDISSYSREQIKEIENWMNNLPRKLLDGLSAKEKVQLYFKEKVA